MPEPVCPQCGQPFVAIDGLCARCRSGEHWFDFARSAFLFDDTLRDLIHHLKYDDRVSLARPMGRLLRDYLDRQAFGSGVIVPVPLHPSRRRERGYNQTQLLVNHLGRRSNDGLIRRRKKTPAQTGLTRNQRETNLRGAFEVRGPLPDEVIVVDDVFTTGSTVNEISRVLRRAGVRRVEVLTLARVEREVTG